MRGGQSPAGYLAARGLDWSNAGFDFSSGERWWLPSNAGDPTSAPRWATRSEWAAQFTRAGSSYYVNALGNLALAGTNELRIDYSSGSPRVLLEGPSTNLTTYSGDTSNAVWTSGNLTKTSGQADPLGGTGAAIFASNADGLRIFRSATASISVTSGAAYTGSFFVKNSSSGFVQLTFPSFYFGANQYANFSLSGNGSVTATGTGTTAQIFKLSNGWYRVSITALATGTGLADGIQAVGITSGTSGRAETVNTSFSITAWGCNVTAQDFLSSYINSVASASSRVGDIFRAPVGAENVGTQSAGTMLVRGRLLKVGTSAALPDMPTIIGNQLGDRMIANRNTTLMRSPDILGTPLNSITLGSGNSLTGYSVALGYDGSGVSGSANGGAIDTTASTLPARTQLYLGTVGTPSTHAFGFGPYKTLALSASRLTNSQLITQSGTI